VAQYGVETPISRGKFGLATGLGEGGEEAFAVSVVAEDFLAAIPAIHDVLDRTGIFEARHEGKRVSISRTLNSENSKKSGTTSFYLLTPALMGDTCP
jgi:hypothetical protein